MDTIVPERAMTVCAVLSIRPPVAPDLANPQLSWPDGPERATRRVYKSEQHGRNREARITPGS